MDVLGSFQAMRVRQLLSQRRSPAACFKDRIKIAWADSKPEFEVIIIGRWYQNTDRQKVLQISTRILGDMILIKSMSELFWLFALLGKFD
jgi:hypothetical protein